RPFPIPAGVAEGGANGGAEAWQQLADGRLFLIDEDRPEDAEAFAAWLYIDDAWQPLQVATQPGYHPVGLAQLPGGDVLLL
ncbi:hypothetical protein, partial [Tritonibacter sp. SIMBA_163]|uniref:hypothetical protein n=1 Tax=Tritonibacter sp. SIMBA_163 TaxID=3080868 RepID=UPI0039816DCA